MCKDSQYIVFLEHQVYEHRIVLKEMTTWVVVIF